MAKKITGYLKLQVPAGSATPSPPIGPALGQRGLNIMEFCKAFNAKTADQEKGAPTPVVITIYADKSFSFETKLAAGDLLPQEGHEPQVRLQAAGQGLRRHHHAEADPRDRRDQDEGPQRL